MAKMLAFGSDARQALERGVNALADAVKAGWAQLDELQEPDFDPLRNREDFKKLLAVLEKK